MNRRDASSPGRGCAVLLGVVLLGGCAAVGPDYRQPALPAPASYSAPLPAGAAAEGADLVQWWKSFGDPLLDTLMVRALERNHDIRLAAARVREARAQAVAAGAAADVRVEAGASVQRQRRSENAVFPLPPGSANPATVYRPGVDLSWELDLFGRIARQVEAADADLAASREDERAVRVALLAEVARQYVDVRALEARVANAGRSLALAEETAGIVRARVSAGLAAEFDALRADELATTVRAQIVQLQGAVRAARLRLALLIGESDPGAIARDLAPGAMPEAEPRLPASVPSDLLSRRPDLRRSERQLAAASARVGVATGELYPRFSLAGNAGFEAIREGRLFLPGSRFWTIGPSLFLPILNGGRIRAGIEAADARLEQAMVGYEKQLATAIEDVEQSTAAYATAAGRRELLRRTERIDADAARLSRERYAQGLADFLVVLDAERQLLAASDGVIQGERDALAGLVSLYRALGGGWDPAAAAERSAGR